MSVMELGHLLTCSGLTYLEVSSEVCHDSFCQLGNSFDVDINNFDCNSKCVVIVIVRMLAN